MCGLAAIFAPEPTPSLAELASAMAETMLHRGPDDRQVVFFDRTHRVAPGDAATAALAFNRLAIQDRSDAGRQPMADPAGQRWLVYNGEVYDYPEHRERLEATGETFRSSGDTEVVLRMLALEHTAALDRMDGMFAFVLIDLAAGRILAARDRFGIKPLYRWTAPDGTVLLASEIKAFTVHPEWRPRLNRPRAADFLARGIIDHTDETLFLDVHALPAGHLIDVPLSAPALAAATPRRWYTPTAGAVTEPADAWPDECRRRLHEAIGRRLRADVPVGTCLSGGLDSSSIVTLVAETRALDGRSGPVTITARPDEPSLDEGRFAHAVVEATRSQGRDVTVTAHELFDRLEDLVWTQDEPFGSPSIFAQFRVFEDAARAGVVVMLDGQGADEQLAGYFTFFPVRLGSLLRRGRFLAAHRFAHDIADRHGQSPFGLAARALATSLPAALRRRLRRDPTGGVVDLAALDPDHVDPFDRLAGARRGLAPFSIDLLRAGSLPMLLHWEDRNSMAHSIEARVPFLAHELVAWHLGLPDEAKLDGGITKAVLRTAMKGRLPERVRTRTDKVAFATPDSAWLGGAFAARVAPLLERALNATGDVLTPEGRTRLRGMSTGSRPYHPILWRVLCFGVWRERFGVT